MTSLLQGERQKSEECIDGYIIEQGKSEGVDKILSPIYLVQDDAISVRVIDVESGNLECAATMPLSKGKMGAKYARYYYGFLFQQLNERCFQIQFPVVRMTEEKKGNAKQFLAAIGNVHHINQKQKVQTYQTVVEKVGDQEFDRTVQGGEGVIEVIEGDHFSLGQINKEYGKRHL